MNHALIKNNTFVKHVHNTSNILLCIVTRTEL